MDIVYFLGQLVLIGVIALIVGLAIIGLLLYVALRHEKVLFPSLIVFLLTALEGPLGAIFNLLKLDKKTIERLEVDIKNSILKPRYAKTKYKDRLLFLPQCLRDSKKCPAKLTDEGYQCVHCGACPISDLKKHAEKLGYKKVFIAPGGKLARRMILRYKPKAVVGAACLTELKEGVDMCTKHRIPAQGIPLMKDGCIDTLIDVDSVKEVVETR